MDATIRCPRCDQEIDAEGPTCPACGHIHVGTLNCERHPDRTAIGVCVVCGDPVCSTCDPTHRVHFSCPNHRGVKVIEGWAQIYSTSDLVEAELIRDNIKADGIDSAVLSQKDRSFNVDLGELSPVRVLVPAFEYVNAMTVIAQRMDGQGEVSFACPSCGEAYDPGDTVCRSCGTPLPNPA